MTLTKRNKFKIYTFPRKEENEEDRLVYNEKITLHTTVCSVFQRRQKCPDHISSQIAKICVSVLGKQDNGFTY